MRVVFGRLWGLWKDLKTSKTQRPYIFRETGTFSFRDMVIFERPWRIFQRCTWSFVKMIFGLTVYLYKSFTHVYHTADALKSILFKHCISRRYNDIQDINHLHGVVYDKHPLPAHRNHSIPRAAYPIHRCPYALGASTSFWWSLVTAIGHSCWQ
jgi:hypothetical protein